MDDNIPEDRLSLVWSPRTATQFRLLRDSQSRWLGPPPGLQDDEVQKYPTSAMPSTSGPGTGGSHIVLGDFRDSSST